MISLRQRAVITPHVANGETALPTLGDDQADVHAVMAQNVQFGHHETWLRILVEDDPVLGPITAEVLEIFGHSTTLAATIEAAMDELSSSNRFDAIVLDLDLGSARGETLIAGARDARLRLPEVVILSALPMDVLRKAQRETHACGAIQKPIAVEDLAQELERCIPVT